MLGYSLTRQFKSRPLGPGYSIVRDHTMIGLSGGLLAPHRSLTLQMLVGSSSSPKRDARWRWKKCWWPTRFLGAERKGWITPWRGYKMDPNFWKTYIFFVSLGRWFYPLGLPWYARKGNLFFKINVHPGWVHWQLLFAGEMAKDPLIPKLQRTTQQISALL